MPRSNQLSYIALQAKTGAGHFGDLLAYCQDNKKICVIDPTKAWAVLTDKLIENLFSWRSRLKNIQRKILVVDDDQTSLDMLERYLTLGENASHQVVKAHDGLEAWTILTSDYEYIDVILLDRMMPVMSGIEFLKKLQDFKAAATIPVIMQTVSDAREDILEGFKLGVYHYLVKPFSPVILNSIVHAAITFYTKQRELSEELSNQKALFKYVDRAVFKIRSLDDINPISTSLALLYPNPDKVVLGISEILTNAIEHGNVGITYEEKTRLNMYCKWREEVERRLKLAENLDKYVTISFFKKKDNILLNVKDEGNGFDYYKYLDFDPSRSTDNHGRGIAFASKLSFDKIEYLGIGNEVNCVVQLNQPQETSH